MKRKRDKNDSSINKAISIARYTAKRKRFRTKMNILMSRVSPIPITVEPMVCSSEMDIAFPKKNIVSIYDLLGDEKPQQKFNCNNVYSQQLLSQTQNMIYSAATPENTEQICIQSSTRNNIEIESSYKLLKKTLYPICSSNTFYQQDNTLIPATFIPVNPYQQTLISIAEGVMAQNIKYSIEPQQKYKLDQICGIKLVWIY